MKLSISNIAWGKQITSELLHFLRASGCQGIEIAPGLLDWSNEKATIRHINSVCDSEGITVTGFHALLYEHPEWRLTEKGHWSPMLDYLELLALRCAALRGSFLVFGSPSSRVLGGVSPTLAMDYAKEFFGILAERCIGTPVSILIEPLPKADLIRSYDEGIFIVEELNHPHLQLVLETRSISDSTAELPILLSRLLPHLKHVHTGGKGLTAPGEGDGILHRLIANTLHDVRYDRYVTLEFVRRADIPDRQWLQRAILFVRNYYCDQPGVT